MSHGRVTQLLIALHVTCSMLGTSRLVRVRLCRPAPYASACTHDFACTQIKEDGVPTQQLWCNSDIYHFDLSYWAFQQLAHPTYGVMMVDFRYAVAADTYWLSGRHFGFSLLRRGSCFLLIPLADSHTVRCSIHACKFGNW